MFVERSGYKITASYVTLVSWLLSNVAPTEFDNDVESLTRDQFAGSTPFRVIGLQQMVFEGQLGLYVAIVPVKQFTAKDLPSKAKVGLDVTSLKRSIFYSLCFRYTELRKFTLTILQTIFTGRKSEIIFWLS